PLRDAASRRSFAAKGQNAFLYQQKSPAYWRRNGPPLGHAVSRRSFAAEGEKSILLSTGIARLLARHDPPLGHAGSRRPFAAEGQKHSSLKRNRPLTGDGMAPLSGTPPPRGPLRAKAKNNFF